MNLLNVWEMNSEIDKARLDHTSLINIAKDYHQHACTDGSECIIYEKKKPLMALRVAPMAGVDLSTLKMVNDKGQKHNFDPSTNLTIGINLNFSMPRLNEKLFLQMQVMYTKYYFFNTYKSTISVNDVHFWSDVLKAGLAVKYEYPKGKWRPTLAAGASLMYLPNGSVEQITDIGYSDEIHSSTIKSNFSVRFMSGFEVLPGIHYYISQKRIIFMQLQYLRCYKREFVLLPAHMNQSFVLSTGIYF